MIVGVKAADWLEDMDNRITCAVESGWDLKIIKPNSNLIIVTGWRAGSGFTNTMRIIKAPRERPVKFQVLSVKFEGPAAD